MSKVDSSLNTVLISDVLSLGQLNQLQFITGVQRCITPEELEEIFHFDIIPSDLLDEANMLPSLQSSSTNIRNAYSMDDGDRVTDEQLKQISRQIAYKNWPRLATKLGFLEDDIDAYESKNSRDTGATVRPRQSSRSSNTPRVCSLQILDLLRLWREQEASLATKNRLSYYLREEGFDELTAILD